MAAPPPLEQVTFTLVTINDNYKQIEFNWTEPPSIPEVEGDEVTPGTPPNAPVTYKIYYSYSGGVPIIFQSGITAGNSSTTVILQFPLAPGDITFSIQSIDSYETASIAAEFTPIEILQLPSPDNKFTALNVSNVNATYTVSSTNATQNITISFDNLVGVITEPDRPVNITYSVYDVNDVQLAQETYPSAIESGGTTPDFVLSFVRLVRLAPAATETYYVRAMVSNNTNAESESSTEYIFTMDTVTTPISSLNVNALIPTATYFPTNLTQEITLTWGIDLGNSDGLGDFIYNIYEGESDSPTTTTTPNIVTGTVIIDKRLRSFDKRDFYIKLVGAENTNIFSEKVKVTYTQPEQQIALSNAIPRMNVTNLQLVSDIPTMDKVNSQTLTFTWDLPEQSLTDDFLEDGTPIRYYLFNDNNVVLGQGVANTSTDDPNQRRIVLEGTRLAPGDYTYHVQLLVAGDAYPNNYSNIFSEKVSKSFTMDPITFPAMELNIADATCSLLTDGDTKNATFTWSNPPSLRDVKYDYKVFRFVPATTERLMFFTLSSSPAETLSQEVSNQDDAITVDSQIYLEVVERENSNVFSEYKQFDITMVCLLKGTLVKTQDSYVAIEHLKAGDVVLNHKQQPTKITKTTMIKLSYIENPVGKEVDTTVYKIPAGEYGATKDVFLTHHHKFLANGKMLKPVEAGLKRATPEEICDENNTYYVCHLRLEDEYNNHFIVNGDCVVEDWWDWPRPTHLERLD